ncbi:4024_t:CDS:2 [Funneliformis geosporum]|uniref:8249_t:CDS:1 n=1 Tax=Funneliformis geosporum TaxID=1117311 RepID=A0A9W4SH67_9GLOM|nr:4024_t:CDS:2 [Funneliformis geosporum]CAI2168211.1 8249_t:CDS:2 [Funneliformis geosporum]
MTDTYLVRIGGKVFEFSEMSLQTDAPNLFTEMFWGGKVYGVKEIFFDRDPVIFEVISRYLRGYEIFPISSINLPVGMTENIFRHNLLRDAKFFQLTKLSESMITMDTRIGDVFNSHLKIEKRLIDIIPHAHLQLKRFGEKQFVVYKSEGMPVVLFHMGGVICDVAPPSSTAEWRFHPVDLEHSRIIRDIIVNIVGESYDHKNDVFNGIKSISAFEIDGQKVYGSEIYSKFKDKTAEVDKYGRIRFLLSKLIFSLEVVGENQYNNNPIGSASSGGKIKHRMKPVWGTGITEPTWLAHRGT